MYRLFTTYYEEKNAARRAELDLCLSLTAAAFDKAYVISECQSFGEQKPHGIFAKYRPNYRQKYSDLLTEAQIAEPGDVTVIANTDIIIPLSTLEVINEHIHPGEAYCLTRWELTKHGIDLWDVRYSQDVWVFRGPPKENIGGDFVFGVPGCDNRFAHELDAAGYTVLNPSKDIRTYHLHLSGYRTSNKRENRVAGPYLLLSPHKLGQLPTYHRPRRESRNISQVPK